jgi:hypothetical protein
MTPRSVEGIRPRLSRQQLAGVVGAFIAVAIAYAAWVSSHDDQATAMVASAPVEAHLGKTQEAEPEPVIPMKRSVSSIPAGVTQADTVMPDEDKLMENLQLLREKSPTEAIALSRRIEEYFPDGRRAAERTYVTVRSLEELKRFREARDEASRMVERFPSDPHTLEVRRHLLVHPLDYPSREAIEAALPAGPPP